MELSTPSFVMEYGFRPNRLFFEYLVEPAEVFSMLVRGHLFELIFAAIFTGIAAFLFWKFSGAVLKNLSFPRPWKRLVFAVFSGTLLFVGARSSFDHRPLNPAMVAFSSDVLVNSLAINSAYSVVFAAKQMRSEEDASKIYGKMPLDEVISRVKKMRGRPDSDYISEDLPTLTFNEALSPKIKNIVIILLESHGAQFVSSLGGKPISPNLDELGNEAWFFENCFATGTRSVRGIEAVVTGFTPTPARSVVKLGRSQNGFFTLADVFADRGWKTAFIYGGESHFDNMASFFYGNGFKKIIDEDDYESPIFTGSWGVSDEDLFSKAHEKFSEWHAAGTPFFSLVFTSSNHDPFEFPDGKIEHFDEKKQTRNNAAKYADFALGEFFKAAKKSKYWKDTIFLVVADHDSRVSGASLVPVKNFHIPALILGEGVPVKRDSRLISQIDLPPTLLSLAGISAEYPMIGFDLAHETPDRAMMIYDKNFALISGTKVVILQPEKPALGFSLAPETLDLVPAEISEEDAKNALALVLFGSYAYKFDFFKDSDSLQNGVPAAAKNGVPAEAENGVPAEAESSVLAE